jgi:RND family efflux transporter MFP subunit
MADSRKILSIVSVLLLLAPVLAGCNEGQAKARLPKEGKNQTAAQGGGAQKSTSDPMASVSPKAGAGGDVSAAPVYTGTTEAHRRSTIAPTIGGMVKKVHVSEGVFVKSGDPIITLNKADILLQKRQAQAAVDAAQANYDLSQMDWERSKALMESGGIAKSQFDMIDAKLKAAKAGLDQAKVALDMARKALADATVRAPYDGLIVKKMVSEGERVNTMPPSALAIIEDVDTIDLRIQVPETEMTLFKVGDEIDVRFAALGKQITAKIAKIVESVDPRTRSFSVIAEIENKSHELRSGMFAEIRIHPGASGEAGK